MLEVPAYSSMDIIALTFLSCHPPLFLKVLKLQSRSKENNPGNRNLRNVCHQELDTLSCKYETSASRFEIWDTIVSFCSLSIPWFFSKSITWWCKSYTSCFSSSTFSCAAAFCDLATLPHRVCAWGNPGFFFSTQITTPNHVPTHLWSCNGFALSHNPDMPTSCSTCLAFTGTEIHRSCMYHTPVTREEHHNHKPLIKCITHLWNLQSFYWNWWTLSDYSKDTESFKGLDSTSSLPVSTNSCKLIFFFFFEGISSRSSWHLVHISFPCNVA